MERRIRLWRRRAALAVALAVGAALLSTPGAHATLPGLNGKIAFMSTRTGNDDIFTISVNADGTAVPGSLRQLTMDKGDDITPRWSPGGARIAWNHWGKGSWDLWLMNADGSGKCRLTYNKALDSSPTWSPDGKQIVFVSGRDGDYDLYVMNAPAPDTCPRSEPASMDLTNALDYPYSEWAPGWSPAAADGTSHIVFMHGPQSAANYDEYLIKQVAGPSASEPFGTWSAPTQLTSTPESDFGAKFSPDGARIAFPRQLDYYRLYTLDIATALAQPLLITSTTSAYPYGYHVRGYGPSYSPDGTMMAIDRQTSYPSGDHDIYVVRLDASGTGASDLVDVTNSPSSDEQQPDWQSL